MATKDELVDDLSTELGLSSSPASTSSNSVSETPAETIKLRVMEHEAGQVDDDVNEEEREQAVKEESRNDVEEGEGEGEGEGEEEEEEEEEEGVRGEERSETPVAPISPITPAEAESAYRDSMASIALSDTSLDYDHLSAEQVEDILATPKVRQSRHLRKPSSLEILQNTWPGRPELERQSTFFDVMKDQPLETPITPYDERAYETRWDDMTEDRAVVEDISVRSDSTADLRIVQTSIPKRGSSLITLHRNSDSSGDDQLEVDWQQLDKVEEQEKEDKDLPAGVEDESTAFLLARLEQENAKITAFSEKSSASKAIGRIRSESRPPSMGHIKKLVQDCNAPSIRYSLAQSAISDAVPEPPPMTELEFWAALVQDYPSTATRLPTLTTTKIRSGIPPPLRGVVWTSMAGARDRSLEDAFDNLLGEKSPYEGIINKDVGRSFPGVELFRDAEGEGQKMLGRVLKCFSLHDKDIGYCQGLGFLVGPLLMNMGEKEAFCVLVRLMDHYHLRPSFLPSLSGLHMRIFQFSSLLKQHQPELSQHLSDLGIEPAYLSQWFLSCFAVTCPLPLLFRIYDVIFAEGANETVMRVALALMRRNEEKMLATTEFEEVMQLLLGRALWDSYGCNPDDLVDDFTGLGGLITHAKLSDLEKEFHNQSSESVGEKAGFLPDVQAAASRFLGRLWAPSSSHGHTPSKSTSTLSPQSAEKDGGHGTSLLSRPGSFLRRSPSKQSIGTLNESDGSSGSGSASLASTAPTDMEAHDATVRESQADTMSFKSIKHPDSLRTVSIATGHSVPPGMSKEERDMHGQIEDLLMALSEMQREHQQLAAMLQKEREERSEDHRVVRQLVIHLTNSNRQSDLARDDKNNGSSAELYDSQDGCIEIHRADITRAGRRRTLPPPKQNSEADVGIETKRRPKSLIITSQVGRQQELNELLEKVQERLDTNARFSASFETKAQLRITLSRTREQLSASENSCRELTARLEIAESALAAFTSESEDLRSEVKELRVRVNEEFKARQKLEHTITELKAEARSMERKHRDRAQRAETSIDQMPRLRRRDSSSGSPAEGGRLRKGSVASAPVSMVGGNGLRELKLGRRDSTSSIQSIRSVKFATRASPIPTIQTEPARSSSSPQVAVSISSFDDAESAGAVTYEHMPTSATSPDSFPGPFSPSLAPPSGPVWHARTSSLATKEVLSTPQHEVVPEEALLLELVNSKTAEAQARQEIDELKRALNINTRKSDAMLAQLRKEIDAAKLEVEKSRQEAQAAHAAADAARAEASAKAEAAAKLFLGTSTNEGLSIPTTPAAYDSDNRSIGTNSDLPTPATPTEADAKPKKSETVSSGWFWSRRTASTTKAAVTPPTE